MGWVNILFVAVAVGIWFAAVYTSHHYILDVLAGVLCAGVGIILFEKVLLKIPAFKQFLNRYFSRI